MAPAPCHRLFQTRAADGRLSLQLHERSCDLFLGVPFFRKATLLGFGLNWLAWPIRHISLLAKRLGKMRVA